MNDSSDSGGTADRNGPALHKLRWPLRVIGGIAWIMDGRQVHIWSRGSTGDVEPDIYALESRDKPALLTAMMENLAGDAHISLEGRLSDFRFPAGLAPSSEPTEALRRHTGATRLDFVILPLRPDTIRPILDVILPENRFMKDIVHIEIERDGRLEFGAYDNFDRDCIVCFRPFPVELLDTLKEEGLIDSWSKLYPVR